METVPFETKYFAQIKMLYTEGRVKMMSFLAIC